MGAMNYNLKKLNHPDRRLRAELLDTNFLSLDVKDIQQEVELIRQLRPNLNRYVYHTSLNFSKGEQEHREGSLGTGQDADLVDNSSARDEYTDFVNKIRVQLSDDIDDEAVHGRNRRRKKMDRRNTR